MVGYGIGWWVVASWRLVGCGTGCTPKTLTITIPDTLVAVFPQHASLSLHTHTEYCIKPTAVTSEDLLGRTVVHYTFEKWSDNDLVDEMGYRTGMCNLDAQHAAVTALHVEPTAGAGWSQEGQVRKDPSDCSVTGGVCSEGDYAGGFDGVSKLRLTDSTTDKPINNGNKDEVPSRLRFGVCGMCGC